MATEYSEKNIKSLVERGDPSFTRVFDGLYLKVTSPHRASWHFRFQQRGRRMQMKIGVYSNDPSSGLLTFGGAVKKAIDLKAQALNGDNPKLDVTKQKLKEIQTVDDLADLYIANKAQKIKTVAILERIYRKDIKPALGHMLLDKVHPFDVYNLLQSIVASGRPSIANKTLYLCKNIFQLGVKNCLIDSNPASNYNVGEDAGGNPPPRDVALTEDELEIVFDVFRAHPVKVPEETYIGITLLLTLGVRKMELFSARWVDIDFKRKYFHLYDSNTKTKKSLAVPIPDDVIPLFERLKVLSRDSEYIFPARKDSSRPFISDDTVNHTLASLFGKKIGKGKTGDNVLGKAGVTEFVVHDLRRTFRTLLASLGVREEVAEKCLNHNFKKIVNVYNRYEYKEERKRAHEKIAQLVLPLAGYPITQTIDDL